MSKEYVNVHARVVHKHDLEVNWQNAEKAVRFIPNQGEIIVYDIEVDESGNVLKVSDGNGGQKDALPEGRTTSYTYERFKIGDGIRTPEELPFIGLAADWNQADWNQTDETKADFIKNKPENLVFSGDGEVADATLPENSGNVQFPSTDVGKFLMVGDDGNIVVSPVSVGSPIIVTDATTMNSILTNATGADVGKCYLYKGETTTDYENGALYIIEAEV